MSGNNNLTLQNALSVQSVGADKPWIEPRSNAPNSPKVHTVHYYGDARKRQKSMGEVWTEDEYHRLARLIILHPISTSHRWKMISHGLAQNPSPSDEAARQNKEKEQAELDKRNAKAKSKEKVELEQCYYCHGCGTKNPKPWSHSDVFDPEAELPEADVCVSCGTANVMRSPEECFMQLPIVFLKFKDKVEKIDDEVNFKKKIGNTFANLPTSLGKETSQEERQENGLYDEEYCYGEFDLKVFISIFGRIKRIFGHMNPGSAGVFWDIGSGMGKLVLSAAALHPFSQVWGLEKLRSLDRIANEMLKEYMRSEMYLNAEPKMTEMQIRCICADMLTTDAWVENTTVIFIHSTTFSDKIMQTLADKAKIMNVGCMMVTVSKPLPDEEHWYRVGEEMVEFSWGKGKVFYHEKISMP